MQYGPNINLAIMLQPHSLLPCDRSASEALKILDICIISFLEFKTLKIPKRHTCRHTDPVKRIYEESSSAQVIIICRSLHISN